MSVVTAGAFAALAVCGVTVLLAVVRLVRGPSVADRVVALDLLSAVAVGIMAAWSVRSCSSCSGNHLEQGGRQAVLERKSTEASREIDCKRL